VVLQLHPRQRRRLPNYGERQRAGEVISTAFTESAINQVIARRMVKQPPLLSP